MTSRQRLLAAIHGDTPDRVPVGPFGLGRLDPDGVAARELIEKTDPFICVGCGGDPVLGKRARAESHGDGNTTTTIIKTPRGDLVRKVRRTDVTSATVEFPFKSPDDVERFLSIAYEAPDIDLSGFVQWKERIGEDGLVLVGIGDAICVPASWFSPEGFCLAWADCPDLVRELTATVADRLNAFVQRLCEAGVDAFRIVGGEYASVQLGPRAFEELVLALDAELVNIMHRYGAIAYFHNHGPIMDYLDAIVRIGVDALDPMEAPPWGDTDLAKAKERLKGRVCMVGNLDDMEVVDRLPASQVMDIARERLAAAGPDGFVLGGTASGTYTEAGARNFIAMVDVAKEFAG
ncbi:MAG: uroporphyrinogen decarboxylase family protein [Armatimonadota bacterium]